MNFLNLKDIEKIDNKLNEIIKDQYSYADGTLFAEVEKIEITYDAGEPFITAIIHFGRFNANEERLNFDHRVELSLTRLNLEFIAGQFYQKIIDEDL